VADLRPGEDAETIEEGALAALGAFDRLGQGGEQAALDLAASDHHSSMWMVIFVQSRSELESTFVDRLAFWTHHVSRIALRLRGSALWARPIDRVWIRF
jgi:hypothetical protein